MAKETNYTADDHFFIGCDVHHIIGGGSGKHILVHPGDGSSAVVDVATWSWTYEIRKSVDNADPAIISVTSGGGAISVFGTYNSSQGSNTQGVDVFLSDTNTLLLIPTGAGTYYWALKREDANLETVVAFGAMEWRFVAVRN